MPEFEPFISFPDQSESFVLGYEAGMIYQQMVNQIDFRENPIPVHTKNVKLIDDMAFKMGYLTMFRKTIYEEWTDFTFIKLIVTDN
jgi:hypothetical protein